MLTRRILITVLLLILPVLCQCVTSTCEIPSVEAGDDATLTIHFGEDLTNETSRDFILVHQGHSAKESQIIMNCHFTNGDVECDKTSCCTWESHVTNVFRVYIHNVSQELEGKFWGYVLPADKTKPTYCNFTLTAFKCSTDSINATNSNVVCNNQPVTINQTCSVTCIPGHYFKENNTSLTYTCVAKNKWFPEIYNTSCEAYTCPTESIRAANSYINDCDNQLVFIRQTCTVKCIFGHYFQENQTSMTYTCVRKNKWSPEIPVISCEEPPKSQESYGLYFLFLLLSVIPIAIVLILLMYRCKRKKKEEKKDEEQPLLTVKETVKASTEENDWIHFMKTWYPEFDKKTHFLPPLRVEKSDDQEPQSSRDLISDLEQCHDQDKRISPSTSDSDVRDNRSLQRVLRGMHTLAENGEEKEVMFVVSQLQFDTNLGDARIAHAAVLPMYPRSPPVAHLRRSDSLPKHIQYHHYDKGDFYVLIIHRRQTLVILQISSVGQDFNEQKMTDQNKDDVLRKKVDEMREQLEKVANVIKQFISDLNLEINIIKRLVMPNITSTHLSGTITNCSTEKDFCDCLGVKSVDDAVKLCLLSDQLSDIHNSSRRALQTWWERSVSAFKQKQSMSIESYEHLVARFCCPATTVEIHCMTAPRLRVRAQGEMMYETEDRVAKLVLFPQQVDILNQSPSRVFVTGPPGTGKTTVLIMQGLTWIQYGHDVHVVSTWDESRAATFAIENQLQETTKTSTARSRVHRHQFDLRKDGEVETAVSCLKSRSEGRQLCVIADVVVRDYRESFRKFCDQLIKEVHCVCIWGASLHRYTEPFCLQEVSLTIPVRSPEVVTIEVKKSLKIKQYAEVHDYTITSVPFQTDSHTVMRITHCIGQSGHTSAWPLNCVQCGYEVVRIMKQLHVGRLGDSTTRSPLQYRDVLVLCDGYPTDDEKDCNDSTASGLVRGLRESKIPVRVVKKGDEAAIRDMALGVNDLLTVASWRDVLGLERKVVVVETEFGLFDEPLYAMSCCSSQLVLIVPDYCYVSSIYL